MSASSSSTCPKWPGYKAGALNFALKQTDPHAEIIGVVDADYVVVSRWLKDLVAHFDDPKIGCRAVPAGASHLGPPGLPAHDELRVRRLLPDRHASSQRAQRHHPARHDDAGARTGAEEPRQLVGVVHLRGCGTRPAPDGCRLRHRLCRRGDGPRPDAGHVLRVQEAAPSLGAGRHADPEGTHPHAVRPQQRRRRPALPLRRRLVLMDRRRAAPGVRIRRNGLDHRHRRLRRTCSACRSSCS